MSLFLKGKKGLLTALAAGAAGIGGAVASRGGSSRTRPRPSVRGTQNRARRSPQPNIRAGINLLFGTKVKALMTSAIGTVAYAYSKLKTDKDGTTSKKVDKVQNSIMNSVFSALGSFAGTVDKAANLFKGGENSGIKDNRLGAVSRSYESGNLGASAISSGKGDKGGKSYGAYQLSSKSGTLDNFLSGSKFKQAFAGLKVGSKGFDKKWRELSKNKEFNDEQYQFIKKTHYDKQLNKLKNDGIDLSGRSRAVQEAVWSTAVQFGGNTKLINNALEDKDVKKLSDSDIIKAIQDHKIKNNSTLFKSSPSLQKATKPTMPSYKPPSIPKINKKEDKTPIIVSVDKGDVNQDLSDRKIAHIATGGYS